MEPQIDKPLLYNATAKDIWDTTQKLYFERQNVSRVAEIDRIYDFLAGLNSKFDIVHGCILGQRPILSLMEVCYEIRLEENHTNAMNSSTILAIDSVAFSARSFTSGSEKEQ